MKSSLLACALAGAAALIVFPNDGSAQTVTAKYEIDNPEAGPVSLNYFQFGYTNDDGDFEPLTGNRVISSRVTINFRPGLVDDGSGNMVPFNVNDLEVSMVVPVILDDPKGTELFQVNGEDLVLTAPNTYTYELITTAFNGEIRSGRFSLDIEAFDSQGEPVPMSGEFFGGSGFFYTVAIPEPATLGAVLPVAMLLRRRARS